MQKNNIQILSTRAISDTLVSTASLYDVVIDQVSFITTEEINSLDIQQKIKDLSHESHFVVFTSFNAVQAVQPFVSKNIDWKIFCIGGQTKTLAEQAFGTDSIIATADNAAQLAEKIISNSSVKKLIFFSGDQRREELPQKLISHGVELQEIVVYKTIETPQKISKNYDGILFFSPSAVRSFFSLNTISNEPAVFAIGNSTKDEINFFSQLSVIMPDSPSAEKLVFTAIQYFSKIKNS